MALVNRSFSVNVTPGMMPPIVHVSEYDVGRAYTVSILDEQGNTFTIPSGTTASIEGTLNGKVGFTQSATVSNNQVSFTLSQSMTAYSGKAWCKIKLTQNSQPIQTCAFVLAVDRAGVEAETVIGAPGFEEQIREAAEDWLEDQGFQSPTVSIAEITGGHRITFTDAQHPQGQSIDVMDGEDTGVEVDTTLATAGMAADSKAAGDKIRALENKQIETDTTLAKTGFAADAKAVGDALEAIDPYIQFIRELMARDEADSLDVSSLPDYWGQPTKDALAYVISLGNGYVNHLVFTDSHVEGTKNAGNSPAIIKVLQDTGHFGKIIHLGDIVDQPIDADWTKAEEQGFTQFNGEMLFAIGNHDDTFNASDTNYTRIYNKLLSESTDLDEGRFDKLYYSYDDTAHKIRYVVINPVGLTSQQTGQADWFPTLFDDLNTTWSVVVLSHYYALWVDQGMGEDYSFLPSWKALMVKQRILDGVPLVGWINGHYHYDWLNEVPGLDFHQMTLNCDTFANTFDNKVRGTATEQAVTIMSINPRTRDVKFYRIGATVPEYGKRWNYKYAQGITSSWITGFFYDTSAQSIRCANSVTYDSAQQKYIYSEGADGWHLYTHVLGDSQSTKDYYVYNKSNPIAEIGGNFYTGKNIGTLVTNSRVRPNTSMSSADPYRVMKVTTSNNFAIIAIKKQDNDANFDVDDVVITDEMPLFTECTLASVGWVAGNYTFGGNYNQTDDTSIASKVFFVESGATYTLTAPSGVGAFTCRFLRSPNGSNGGMTNLVESKTCQNGGTVVVPSTANYCVLTRRNADVEGINTSAITFTKV